MKKKLIFVAAGLVLALVVGFLVARQIAIGYLTPDFLVRQIESRWRCRAHIDSVDVRILGNATVELKGVALGKRDPFARKGTPLADRSPMEKAEISSETVTLEVRPLALVNRQLDIRRLILTNAHAETAIRKNGDYSIEQLFDEPGGWRKQQPVEASEDPLQAADRKGKGDSDAETPPEPEEDAFSVTSIPVSMVADRIEVKNGTIRARINQSGARVTLSDLQFAFTEIDVDPAALTTRNRTSFQFGTELLVQPPEEDGGEFVRANLSGSGDMRPFDPVTGEMDPVFNTGLTMHAGSKLDTFPVVEKLKSLLEEVDTAGIRFDDFNLRGELEEDAHTRIGYGQARFTFEEPMPIALPDTTVAIHAGSWIDSGTNEHRIKGTVIASEALTGKIEGMVDAYLEEKAALLATESVRNTILELLTLDERVAIEVVSEGDLGDPKADIVTPLGNLTEVIDTGKKVRDTFKEAGKSILKGLFGGGDEPESESE